MVRTDGPLRRIERPPGSAPPGAAVRGEPSASERQLSRDAPPRPLPGDPPHATWAVVAQDRAAAKAWRDLCASHANACQRAYDQLSVNPHHVDGHRWIELAGGRFAGIRQHEIGGGQRIWYRIDDDRRVVIVVPHTAHPKATE